MQPETSLRLEVMSEDLVGKPFVVRHFYVRTHQVMQQQEILMSVGLQELMDVKVQELHTPKLRLVEMSKETISLEGLLDKVISQSLLMCIQVDQ